MSRAPIEDVSGLLDSPDDEAEGLDLAGEPAAQPASPAAPATKSCPYCGERVLAVAAVCKHCGSDIAEVRGTAYPPAKINHPAPEISSSLGIASLIVAILAFFAFFIPLAGISLGLLGLVWVPFVGSAVGALGLALGIMALAFARRRGGAGVGFGVAGTAVSLFVIVPTVIFAVVILVASMATHSPPPVQPSPPVVSVPLPAPPTLPIPKPKPSAEEKAYAVKLAAFLDGFDKATQLLETAPKPDEYRKQYQALEKVYEAVPPPPSGVPWTQDAAASSKRLLDLADMLNSSLTTLDEAMKALGQSAANSPESQEACRQAAAQMRSLSATTRGLIPPACLSP